MDSTEKLSPVESQDELSSVPADVSVVETASKIQTVLTDFDGNVGASAGVASSEPLSGTESPHPVSEMENNRETIESLPSTAESFSENEKNVEKTEKVEAEKTENVENVTEKTIESSMTEESILPGRTSAETGMNVSESSSDMTSPVAESDVTPASQPSVEPTPTVQKLTIKIPRSMSIPSAPMSAKIEPSGLALLATAAALCDNLVVEQPDTKGEEVLEEDVRLRIATEETVAVPVKKRLKIRPVTKKRPVFDEPDEDEEDMLRHGTEIDGYIYYPAKTSRIATSETASAGAVAPPTTPGGLAPPTTPGGLAPSTTPGGAAPSVVTTSGRPARQAALNNRLIRGGFIPETEIDNDTLYRRDLPRLSSPSSSSSRSPSKRPKPTAVLDDPQAKLAKVKASLKTATPFSGSASEKQLATLPKPVKITATAKQRLGRKLGLK